MKYKLVAIDIDGTLINDEKRLPQGNIDAMKRAAAAGAHIMIATGRPYRASTWVLEQAGMEGLILSVGGGMVTKYPDGVNEYAAELPADFVREFTAYCDEKGWFYHCLSGSDINYARECRESVMTENYFGYPGRILDFSSEHGLIFNKSNVIRLDGDTRQVAEELAAKFEGRAEIMVSDSAVIDITPLGVNKAATLLTVAQKLGVKPEEIIAIGDQDSDISMICAAGLGVAMANSSKNTLAAADYVAPSNNDCGVAHVLDKFITSESSES